MNESSSAICVLTSGGLDSAVLTAEVLPQYARVFPVYIRSGLRWEDVELYWLRQFLDRLRDERLHPLTVMQLPVDDVYGGHWSVTGDGVPEYEAAWDSVYLPGRNIILVAKAAIFCALRGVSTIALGLLEGNPFPDATPAFLSLMERTLSQGLAHQLTILAPYRGLSKSEIIQRGRHLPLELTFSCLAPVGQQHCGRCSKCAERQQAFAQAGLADPTAYAHSL
ncbi:MAG: 7-cyano-7-deazaguanine synthase [Blastocatellia bacterium]|nr:7-cyano-7-deazaguanine synthase [Blastocatellia bacterium]MCS7156967.1 7-cyano-7-deazaguanine synthase [Blastocatellia bacterium]MCX7752168.1 7-cyano-7-deazaguanine synthase [Blastocatellia bacterium]MDW8167660.1 7-cyano-7-deazaguanine synthase [Acidobacteriota bacterium]MDW8256259.1 7-cyano-7-deazaguanine synthase [Acidobacteriota bacterium]